MTEILANYTFPPKPYILEKLQKLENDNKLTQDSLVKLLETDPLLCISIIKLVNSPYYGLRQQVSSISHAVILLGVTIIRGIIIAVFLKNSFPLDLSIYNATIDDFDEVCQLRLNFLKTWSIKANFPIQQKEELYSAAFLMESGKIVAAHILKENNKVDLFKELVKKVTPLKAEKQILGKTNYELTAMLFEKWGFDLNFVDLIKHFFDANNLKQQILFITYILIQLNNILNEKNIEEALKIANIFNMDEKILLQVIEIIKEKL
jgi:HD-like signal output (HDOD) protein